MTWDLAEAEGCGPRQVVLDNSGGLQALGLAQCSGVADHLLDMALCHAELACCPRVADCCLTVALGLRAVGAR